MLFSSSLPRRPCPTETAMARHHAFLNCWIREPFLLPEVFPVLPFTLFTPRFSSFSYTYIQYHQVTFFFREPILPKTLNYHWSSLSASHNTTVFLFCHVAFSLPSSPFLLQPAFLENGRPRVCRHMPETPSHATAAQIHAKLPKNAQVTTPYFPFPPLVCHASFCLLIVRLLFFS